MRVSCRGTGGARCRWQGSAGSSLAALLPCPSPSPDPLLSPSGFRRNASLTATASRHDAPPTGTPSHHRATWGLEATPPRSLRPRYRLTPPCLAPPRKIHRPPRPTAVNLSDAATKLQILVSKDSKNRK